jgi:hypothetical protein
VALVNPVGDVGNGDNVGDMTDFIGADLSGPRFERTKLIGAWTG